MKTEHSRCLPRARCNKRISCPAQRLFSSPRSSCLLRKDLCLMKNREKTARNYPRLQPQQKIFRDPRRSYRGPSTIARPIFLETAITEQGAKLEKLSILFDVFFCFFFCPSIILGWITNHERPTLTSLQTIIESAIFERVLVTSSRDP